MFTELVTREMAALLQSSVEMLDWTFGKETSLLITTPFWCKNHFTFYYYTMLSKGVAPLCIGSPLRHWTPGRLQPPTRRPRILTRRWSNEYQHCHTQMEAGSLWLVTSFISRNLQRFQVLRKCILWPTNFIKFCLKSPYLSTDQFCKENKFC